MTKTYRIERRERVAWACDEIGEAGGWTSIRQATAAIRSLRALGDEWSGDYRVVHEQTGGIVAGVTLRRRTRAGVER
jgi:hypothetical protein